MKIEIEESALDSIAEMGKRLQEERDELLGFVKEYAEAWKDGMAGDSCFLRMANSLIDRCNSSPKVM